MANKDSKGRFVTKHGQYGTRTYQSWIQMRARCLRPQHHAYDRYSHLGICDRWSDFEAFLADMGERPEGTSLDRKDNSLGYSPENCRWATPKEQMTNRSNTRWLTIDGVKKTWGEWAAEAGIDWCTLRDRLLRGWPENLAATLPKGSRYSHCRTSKSRRL